MLWLTLAAMIDECRQFQHPLHVRTYSYVRTVRSLVFSSSRSSCNGNRRHATWRGVSADWLRVHCTACREVSKHRVRCLHSTPLQYPYNNVATYWYLSLSSCLERLGMQQRSGKAIGIADSQIDNYLWFGPTTRPRLRLSLSKPRHGSKTCVYLMMILPLLHVK